MICSIDGLYINGLQPCLVSFENMKTICCTQRRPFTSQSQNPHSLSATQGEDIWMTTVAVQNLSMIYRSYTPQSWRKAKPQSSGSLICTAANNQLIFQITFCAAVIGPALHIAISLHCYWGIYSKLVTVDQLKASFCLWFKVIYYRYYLL